MSVLGNTAPSHEGTGDLGNGDCSAQEVTWGSESMIKMALQLWGRVAQFSGGSVVKSTPANAEDTGSIPDLGRSHMPRSS